MTPSFSELTTMRVGGTATDYRRVETTDDLANVFAEFRDSGEPWMVLGGGSNLVVADEGTSGGVIHMATRGIERLSSGSGFVRLRVQAGEVWDDLVRYTVENGYVGIEALSGIPGSVGAAPVQNIGAYGQEIASTLLAIEFLDAETGEQTRIPARDLELAYRTSLIKQGNLPGIVTAIEIVLDDASGAKLGEVLSAPIAYEQLARALDVTMGTRVPLTQVRSSVLALRSSKGMVLDSNDHDTWSCGSFFTNPIVSNHVSRGLPTNLPRWPQGSVTHDAVYPLDQWSGDVVVTRDAPPESESRVKVSAAWLVEQAGISRGFALPGSGASISHKHTLAITNRGRASASDVFQLADYVTRRVEAEFGVTLHPEPILVGNSRDEVFHS